MAKENRRFQYLVAYAVSVAAVAVGAFATWSAPVLPKFHANETNINISDNEIAWVIALSSPGVMSGSLAVSFIADRFGRKTTILMSALPFAIGTVILATAVQPWLLYITRYMWGISTGMYFAVNTLYLAEISDKEIRGALTMVTRYMFNFGSLLMMCIGPFVSYTTLNYILLVLPVLHFLGCFWIPESPYFCLKEGKEDAARTVLKKIRIYEDDKSLEDDLNQLKADVKNEMRHSSTAKELFTGKKYRKAVIIAGGLKFAQIMSGQLIVSEYLGLIMLESGTTINLTTIFILFGIIRFSTSVMTSLLADRLGRRPLLMYSFLGSGICTIIIGIYFFFKEVLKYNMDSLGPYSFIPFAGVIACNVISTLGFYSIIVVVPSEIFPLNVKAIAMTSVYILGGLLNFVAGRGYQSLKDAAGLYGVFWFLSAAAIGGSIFTFFCVPETKGKSLREIQEQLQGDLYENDEEPNKLNNGKNLIVGKDEIEMKKLLEDENRIDIVKS